MESYMVKRIARLIYDELEGPVNNQDFARQTRQWERAMAVAESILGALIAHDNPDHQPASTVNET